MSKLIKNELIKIFSKKSIYVVLIITLAFMILYNVLTKVFSDDFYDAYSDETLDILKESLSYLEQSDDTEDAEYILDCKTSIAQAELGRNYEKNSWQRYIIERDIVPIIRTMLSVEGTDAEKDFKAEYDAIVEKLDADDWKYFVNKDLDDVNSQIESASSDTDLEDLKNQKQALEWRLEKNIDYGSSPLNTYITLWLYAKSSVAEYEQSSKTETVEYEDKYQNQSNVNLLNVCEYAINNNINESLIELDDSFYWNSYGGISTSLPTNAKTALMGSLSTYQFFVLILAIMVAGTIVSDEFNKGTIKLLLVRPYNRVKILLSKFLTCLIILIFGIAFIYLVQTIVGGFLYGFNTYSLPTPVYNFSTSSLEVIGTVKYLALNTLGQLPMFILLMTLSFAMSIIFNNTPIAIALPLLGTIGAGIINSIAYLYEKAKFLMYFVTPNWDLSIFLFGKLPQFEPISLPFSIIVCIVYFAIMMFVSISIFKNRDIKNV